ncbi:hypothetical protein N9V82_01695, partial [Candidatus Poseidoniales archaeon]|nr:hypothetical protein [Candidatus Poseidoniales archaeon]
QTDLMVASYQASEWAWAISGGSVNEDRAWDCSGSPTQGLTVVGEFIGNATLSCLSHRMRHSVRLID